MADPVVDIVAPGSACSRERLDAGLATLRAWGFAPRVPVDLFGPRGITAHTDARRLQLLHAAMRAPDSRLVWSVRGGYGCLRLLAGLARRSAPREDKLLLGFSDVGAAQHMLRARFGLDALHAPVVAQLGNDEIDSKSLRAVRAAAMALASGAGTRFEYSRLVALNDAAHRSRTLRGVLQGTNLRTICTLLGTPWQPAGEGAIWCFEDVGERGYAIDRMLTQLILAGVFFGTRAVIFGGFSGAKEPNGSSTVPSVLRDFAAAVRFPVLRGLGIGHGRRNLALPLGVQAKLALGDAPSLSATMG